VPSTLSASGAPATSGGASIAEGAATGGAPKLYPLAVGATEAARLCGVSRAMWYSLRKAGRVPRPVRLGGRVVWRVDELRAWLAAGCQTLPRWESMRKPLRE